MEKTLHLREYHVLLDLLREARIAAGVNQIDLADRVGMTQSMVSKCERGERRLDVIELRRWCGAIDVPFLPLLEEFEMRLMAKPARRNSRNRRT